MGMAPPEINVPAVFKLMNRLNKMDGLRASGLGEGTLVILEDDEPPGVRVEVGEFRRIASGSPSALVAVDSSAIPLAYAERKWYLVFSAGIVVRGGAGSPPSIFRVGPQLAELERREGEDQQAAARRLRERVEGSIVMELLREDAIRGRTLILVDGSLTGLSELECSAARGRDVHLIGISKATKVVPSALGVLPPGPGYSVLYRSGCYYVTAARLEEYGIPLRVDVVDLESLSSLLASDVIVRGYPDSLRLAHYSSIISTAEEVAAVASLAMRGASLTKPLERREALLGLLKVRG